MLFSNIAAMDQNNSPKKKITRFSEHPQVFEYSSRSKKGINESDNDSLLLDNNDYEMQEFDPINQAQKQNEYIDFQKKHLNLQQITSQLAEIQAYLNQPIQKEHQINKVTPTKTQLAKQQHNIYNRFSFNPKSPMMQGRQTMDIPQQQKLRSQLKSIPRSNNKVTKQQIRETAHQQHQATIQEKIQKNQKNKQRITMDTQALMNMISSYQQQNSQRKYNETRKNRITLDVYALSKMIEGMNSQEIKQEEQENIVTPIKNEPIFNAREGSLRKSTVFSAYKQNPTQGELSMEIMKYMNEVKQRTNNRKQENYKLLQYLNQIKSDINKTELRIDSVNKQIEKSQEQIKRKKIRKYNIRKVVDSQNYLQDLEKIKVMEEKYNIGISKYQQRQDGMVAHINLNGIYTKLKSRGKNHSTDLKLKISNEIRECQNMFLFNMQSIVQFLKKYHNKSLQHKTNLLQISIKLRQALQILILLDLDLKYLSLNFQFQNFQLKPSDHFVFHIGIGSAVSLLFELNLHQYIQSPDNLKSFSIYNIKQRNYIQLMLEQNWKQIHNNSLMYAIMHHLLVQYC